MAGICPARCPELSQKIICQLFTLFDCRKQNVKPRQGTGVRRMACMLYYSCLRNVMRGGNKTHIVTRVNTNPLGLAFGFAVCGKLLFLYL
jgi:hypothetical protein